MFAIADKDDPNVTEADQSLVLLLQSLAAQRYRFTTVTPLTHQRVLAQRSETGKSLRDIFGWNMPFSCDALPSPLRDLMIEADLLCSCSLENKSDYRDTKDKPLGKTPDSPDNDFLSNDLLTNDLLKSTVRVSLLDDDLFVHSAFPTSAADAVFFGPDTYRFARFIQQAIKTDVSTEPATLSAQYQPYRIADVGCGSGAGGIVAARAMTDIFSRKSEGFSTSELESLTTFQYRTLGAVKNSPAIELTMTDINPLALTYTAANACAAGIPVTLALSDVLTAVEGEFDLIVSNPPYLNDSVGRAYRHGGERLGRALSVRIVDEAVKRLAPGGHLLLYTGVAMVDEVDPFLVELTALLNSDAYQWSYEEIDPDIFGEELDRPIYAQAHRIAAVGLIVKRLR